MTEREKTDAVVALEQARAQLEVALSRDEDWLALGRDAGDASRDERALADNPLYKSWKQVSQAIENLRAAEHGPEPAEGGQSGNAESRAAVEDLTRIRGITSALAGRLAALGITRYGDIAAWRPYDVRQVSDALGLGREISRQNWIEQAALLHRRTHPGQSEPTMAPSFAEQAKALAARTEEPLSNVSHALGSDARTQPRSIDLPDILEHIRSDAARGSEAPALLLDEHNKGPAEVPERRAEPRRDEIENVPVTLAPAAPQRSPIPIVEASSDVNTDAEERVKRLAQERRQAPAPVEGTPASDGTRPVPLEPEEAIVTFVIREPARPAGAVPTVGALERRPLVDRPPASAEEDGPRAEPYVPPDGPAEEAEVAIVVSDSGEAKRTRGGPAGSVRRFLKTLTGN